MADLSGQRHIREWDNKVLAKSAVKKGSEKKNDLRAATGVWYSWIPELIRE